MKYLKSFRDLYENTPESSSGKGKESFDKWVDSQIRSSIGYSNSSDSESVSTSDSESVSTSDAESPVSGELILPSAAPANQKQAMQELVEALNKHGLTNPHVQRAVLGVVSKESGFNPTVAEISYRNTPASRIREVFGRRVKDLTDAQIEELRKDDAKFWDRVYGVDCPTDAGKQLGNDQPGDGWKYRGRGYNGLTGKSNYKKYTNLLKKAGTNVDLVADPETLEKNSKIAAEVAALYFKEVLNNPTIKRKYSNSNENDFQDLKTAVRAVNNANAGPGSNVDAGIIGDGTKKALAFAEKVEVKDLSTTA